MKRLLLFILLFCVQLAVNNVDARASKQLNGVTFAAEQIADNLLPATATKSPSGYLVTEEDGQGGDHPYLTSVEEDDEEEEDLIRRQASLVQYVLALSNVFFLRDCNNSLSEPIRYHPFIVCTGTSKYIVQRVLRI